MSLFSESEDTIDQAVRWVFRDKEWIPRSGIGGLLVGLCIVVMPTGLLFIPLVFAFWALIVGYSLRVMRQKVSKPALGLPFWNEWGDLFMSGITWIAFQVVLWLLMGALCGAMLLLALSAGYQCETQLQMSIWIGSGVTFSFVLWTFFSFLSSYVMINFACQENTRAALAFPSVVERVKKRPLWYIAGFLLASGFQILSLIVPVATVVGIIVMPTAYFLGQVLSASTLAFFWRTGEA